MNTTITKTKTILSYIYASLETIFRVIGNGFLQAIESYFKEDDRRLYKAEFGKSGEIFSSWNKGFVLGNERISLPDSYRNMLIQGPTGTGKGVNLIIPTILKLKHASLIVHDPSGENFMKTSGGVSQEGRKVHLINPNDPLHSDSINFLDLVKSDSDANKVATIFIRSSNKSTGGEQFWILLSIAFLRMFILIAMTQPKAKRNMRYVKSLITSFSAEPKAIDELFSKYASEPLFKDYKAFLSYDSKVIAGVLLALVLHYKYSTTPKFVN